MLKENNPIRQEFKVDKWHDKGFTGKGVNILILDLNGKILDEMKEYATLIDPEKYIVDETKHNTYTTQVAHEFAPGAHIYVAPWSHSPNSIAEWVRKNPNLIDIVNVSLSCPRTNEFDVFKELDIPLCASSGNDSSRHRMGVNFPASEPWAIAVGAYNWKDKGFETPNDVVNYSNGGEDLECVAPTNVGVKNIKGEIFDYTGTSTSSPALVGMLACYIQFRKENGLPKLGCLEAIKFVQETSIDIKANGFDYDSGYGLFIMPEIPQVIKKPVPKPTPKEENKYHIVKPTNSISGIAKLYGISKQDIVKWNKLKNDKVKLKVGQKIIIKKP